MELVTYVENGFTAKDLQENITKFNNYVKKQFPDCVIEHFYYGENVDMVDVFLPYSDTPRDYANFTITRHRIALTGYGCHNDNLKKFERCTLNDELYVGAI